MGRHKALLPVGGIPLLCAHLDALRPHTCALRVGLGAEADRLRAVLPEDAAVILSPSWQTTGPRETLLCLLEGLPDAQPILVTPVDVPPAPARVLSALLAAGPPALPTHGGQPGHPLLLTAGGARRALAVGTLKVAAAQATAVAVDWPGALRNLNTPADWRAWTGAAP